MLEKTVHPSIFQDIRAIAAKDIAWERFKNKTILISGANGFLASYLVYLFLFLNEQRGINCKVVGISRNKERVFLRFGELLKNKGLEIIFGDVSQPVNVANKIDFVIHAASQASPKYYGIDPVGTLNANVLGTNNMLQLAHRDQAESFLFFSSSEVYGSLPADKIPTKENEYGYIDIANVRACYAEGKRIGETMAVCWFHQFGVPVKMVRPFHTYGPGMDLNDGRVYADFVSDIVNNRDIVMKSDGSARRAFCHLRDATEGFIRILLDGNNGEAYNMGNPKEEISVIRLAERLVALFPDKGLKVQRQKQGDQGYIASAVSRNSPDISKMIKLGWSPVVSIDDGFKQTIISYL